MLQDYYQLLQVHPQAENDVIEAAYKRLAKKYHPDVSEMDEEQALARMQAINEAYNVLKDPAARLQYHKKWQASYAKVGSDSGFTKQQATSSPNHPQAYQAMSALTNYFEHIQKKAYDQAYRMITKSDKLMIKEEAYIRWQTAVSQIFALQNFQLQLGLNDDQSTSLQGGNTLRFVVMTVDYNAIMDRLEQDVFEKKMVKEGASWKISLGVADVEPLILRFEQLASLLHAKSTMKAYVDSYGKQDSVTGALNKRGLLDLIEREGMRFNRYNRRFVLVMIGYMPQKNMANAQHEDVLSCIASVLKQRSRELDSVGRWGEQTFVILMPETDLRGGLLATQKLKRYLQKEICPGSKAKSISFPAAVDVFSGDLPAAIDRLDFLYEASKRHKLFAIQSIRGALAE